MKLSYKGKFKDFLRHLESMIELDNILKKG